MKVRIKSGYIKWGITALIVGGLLILFYFSARSVGNVLRIIPILLNILKPFIIGFVMAYLICPVYNGIVRRFRGPLTARCGDAGKGLKRSKLISLILSVIILIAVVSGLIYLVLPALVSTIADLVSNLPDMFRRSMAWISEKASNYTTWAPIQDIIGNSNDKLLEWLTDKVLPASRNLMSGISSVLSTVVDTLIGFIVMIYILISKDTFTAQSKKLVYCLFSEERADSILSGASVVNNVFNRYISSNIIDALIIGGITFVFMLVTRFEYGALIAVLVGVTNLIPFFGPFIGAIPSALLLLTTTPIHALYFIIFIIILQQMDGHVIKPWIFAEGVGLPSFWVLFAILVGGGLFGFIGMLIGVPVFAVIYQFITYKVNSRMSRKHLDTSLTEYMDLSVYDKRKRGDKKKQKKFGSRYKEDEDEHREDQ